MAHAAGCDDLQIGHLSQRSGHLGGSASQHAIAGNLSVERMNNAHLVHKFAEFHCGQFNLSLPSMGNNHAITRI